MARPDFIEPLMYSDLDVFFSQKDDGQNYPYQKRTTKVSSGQPKKAKSTRSTNSSKKAPARLNYDGMSFNEAFASALKVGRSVFDWRGKRYSTQLAPENVEVPMPTIELEPMDTAYNPADTSLHSYTPTAAMASYQADAGLRRAAMAPVQQVPLTGVKVPQYGWGGWLMPICPK